MLYVPTYLPVYIYTTRFGRASRIVLGGAVERAAIRALHVERRGGKV